MSHNLLLARVYLREDDKLEGKLAYRRVLELLKEWGVEGATVLKSVMGYGTTKSFHYEGLEVLSYGLPVVVEFIDEEPKVMTAVERLISKFGNLFITLEEVQVCPYS
jgi:PII-like signaling protein